MENSYRIKNHKEEKGIWENTFANEKQMQIPATQNIEEVTCPFLEVGQGCPERVTSCPRNRILSSRQHCWYLSLRTFAGLEEKNHPSHHYHHLIESVTLQGFA